MITMVPRSHKPLTYREAGVDIDAGDAFVGLIQRTMRRTHSTRVIRHPNGFAGLFRLDDDDMFQRNYDRPVLVGTTDGVGTKVKLATDLGVFDTIGVDCVAMNVNDLIFRGAEPLFFLDYLAVHSLDLNMAAKVVQGVGKGCLTANCSLLGGETAEMPDVYAPGDFDLAGFAVGVVELHRTSPPSRVQAGELLIGLASAGVHSNGFALIRQIIRREKLNLHRTYPDFGTQTLGESLMTPTRIYVRPIVALLRRYKVKRVVSAMAHITGGGLPGNVRRVLHNAIDAKIDTSSWSVPPIFEFLQGHGHVDRNEMFRVFNMGIGYVLVVRPNFANSVVRFLNKKENALNARVIGEIIRGSGRVRLV